MSNLSHGSSGCSNPKSLPRKCWCGQPLVTLTSKTSTNPHRRFYCCSYAAGEKLSNDKHAFKWVDETIEKEIGKLEETVAAIEETVTTISKMLDEAEKLFEKMEGEIEEKVYERLEPLIKESEARMKKMVLAVTTTFMVGLVAIYILW